MQIFRPLNKTLSFNSSKDSFMLGPHNFTALIQWVKDRDAGEHPTSLRRVPQTRSHSAQYVSSAKSRIPTVKDCSGVPGSTFLPTASFTYDKISFLKLLQYGTLPVLRTGCFSFFCSRPTLPHVTTCPARPWSDPKKLPEPLVLSSPTVAHLIPIQAPVTTQKEVCMKLTILIFIACFSGAGSKTWPEKTKR